MSSSSPSSELTSNRKARHEYEILETFEAGIELRGTEVKSLRDHGGSLQEAYVRPIEGELWLISAHIASYRFGNLHNHEERRNRKLLMHKREIARLAAKVQEKGLTLVPLSFYLKNGKVKVKIGIAKGKKLWDKREAVKNRDEARRIRQGDE